MFRGFCQSTWFLAVLFCSPCYADTLTLESIPIPYEGRTIGTLEILDHRNSAQEPARFIVDLRARFPDFPDELDAVMQAKGNLGRPVHEVFWRGGTSIVSAGPVLRMTTLIRYKWRPNFGAGRTTMLDVSRWADWHVFITPGSADELRLGFSVDNIRGVRNDIEKIVGARITRQTGIELPARCGRCACSDVFALVRPEVETVRFSDQDETVELFASISFALDDPGVLSCIGG